MRVKIGVSACLLGEAVRWDGGHKRHGFVADSLPLWAELVPVCPEVELGLGVPREPIELRRKGGSVALVGRESGRDLTARASAMARERVRELRVLGIAGYVLKARSPSCGLRGVPVHGEVGAPEETGVGVFARALVEELPGLPVEEESGLDDPARRESFVAAVLAYHRARETQAPGR